MTTEEKLEQIKAMEAQNKEAIRDHIVEITEETQFLGEAPVIETEEIDIVEKAKSLSTAMLLVIFKRMERDLRGRAPLLGDASTCLKLLDEAFAQWIHIRVLEQDRF